MPIFSRESHNHLSLWWFWTAAPEFCCLELRVFREHAKGAQVFLQKYYFLTSSFAQLALWLPLEWTDWSDTSLYCTLKANHWKHKVKEVKSISPKFEYQSRERKFRNWFILYFLDTKLTLCILWNCSFLSIDYKGNWRPLAQAWTYRNYTIKVQGICHNSWAPNFLIHKTPFVLSPSWFTNDPCKQWYSIIMSLHKQQGA